MTRDDFCVFIISHGRPDNIKTIDTLKRQNCNYPVFVVVDNEDKTIEKYRSNYGSNLVEFDKKKYADMTDEGDNFNNRRTTTHARNACFDLCKQLGFRFFLVLDDDYTRFCYSQKNDGTYDTKHKSIKEIDRVMDEYVSFLINSKSHSVSFAQGGDFIGGENSGLWKNGLRRKCMNAWFCDTEKPFLFFSRLNEDVNTYLTLGTKGNLFLTPKFIRLEQERTQASEGGMTDAYLDNGTYVKSFYSVMYNPSFVKITTMGVKQRRLHHRIKWKNAVPCIISQDHKKA